MKLSSHHKRRKCRICGGDQLQRFLSLGQQPLANAFLKSESEFSNEEFFPLDVYYCMGCSLVQLLDVIDPEVLFRNYVYVTGTSETIAAHNIAYARTVTSLLGLTSTDLVVEIASNDGSLLRCFKDHHVKVLGVEPATNIAEIARGFGIETVNDFFNASTADKLLAKYGNAKAVIGNNVLAHVDETRDFILGCKKLLAQDGLVIIEVPYLRDLLDRYEYDTIYHEHLCYFSVSTLMRLCESAGLSIVKVEHVPVHGGSIRMYAGLSETFGSHSEDTMAIVRKESELGLNDLARYEDFSAGVQQNRVTLLQLLRSLKDQGKKIAGYGAPAKGNTLLNYCGIDDQLLSFTVDRNPLKVGMFTPGMHIPVLPVDTLVNELPKYVLILAWNFAEEIIIQQEKYRQSGGRFILPIPDAKVI